MTWKWKMTSKQREYEFRVPRFESLMLCVFAHSLTCTTSIIYINNGYVVGSREGASGRVENWTNKRTSKTKSRNLVSIKLIQYSSLDFIWPTKLFTDKSQEMLYFPWNTRWGDLDISIELANAADISPTAMKKLKEILLQDVLNALRSTGIMLPIKLWVPS